MHLCLLDVCCLYLNAGRKIFTPAPTPTLSAPTISLILPFPTMTSHMDLPTTERDVQLSRSLFLCGIVIVSYDHILTLGPEIQHIWPTRRSFSSAWFLSIRYFAFCSNVIVTLDTFGDFKSKRCNILNILVGFLILGQEFMIACTICLRIYAMYGLSKKLLAFMACAMMITVGVSVWALVPAGPTPTVSVRAQGCYVPQSKAQDFRLIGAWGAQLAGDVIAISLILYRAYTHGQGTSVLRTSLWGVLIRDGIVYFLMISLANIANLIVFYFGDIYTSTTLTWFTSAVSVTMVLRLMINLHLAAAPERTDFGGTSTNPIHFVSRARGPRDTFDLNAP
ncbi:hypothetical protein K438DRAFT_1867430 [Mycena galopus ATCC 62051]|nr:hypothetical protein K438DRAFT_1875769 [Mycena galopus ATCC 62051]KAF8147632.1 hypothetical protein K438DRAFT_1867430 [Mycena galopus ATCC 62051]